MVDSTSVSLWKIRPIESKYRFVGVTGLLHCGATLDGGGVAVEVQWDSITSFSFTPTMSWKPCKIIKLFYASYYSNMLVLVSACGFTRVIRIKLSLYFNPGHSLSEYLPNFIKSSSVVTVWLNNKHQKYSICNISRTDSCCNKV